MLSVASDALRFSPSQNIRGKKLASKSQSVMYITDRSLKLAHNYIAGLTEKLTLANRLLRGSERSLISLGHRWLHGVVSCLPRRGIG
jgi:hypothetical protein